MKRKRLFVLCFSITVVCTTVITAQAPAGWRNLPDFYVFKDKVGGWSGCGAGELETVNGNLPVDTQVTYENLPSLRFNLTTQLTSWMSIIITLAEWCNHDVSRYVPNGYLEFNVKGKTGGEQFVIGAVDHVSERASGIEHTTTKPVTNYCSVTTGWQHVKIPLKDILDPVLGMDPYNAKALVLDKVTANPFCVWINQLKLTSPDKENAFPAIKVNQVGFREASEKYAYVSGFEDDFTATAGTTFQVKRVSDNTVVYSGQLVLVAGYDGNDSGERVFKAVFTDLKQPGDYYITVNAPAIEQSPKFKIGNDVYKPLLADVTRYMYYQRAGINLVAPYCPDYPRNDKTALDATAIFESNSSVTRDVSKGWYDAGDLGKYVTTGAGTVINMLWSLELFPEVYQDNQFNIPESGNGKLDILDEVKWELDWMLKMQDAASGGFYAQVQSDDDGNITKRIIKDTVDGVTNVRPTEPTASAAAALAQASLLFAKSDAAYAQTCLNAAKNAWTYLEKNPNNIKAMGPYGTDDDTKYRFLAAASLYRATGETKYNDYFMANYTGDKDAYENATGDFIGTRSFAYFAYLKASNRNSDAVKWFTNEFTIWVNNKIARYQSSAWGNTIANGNYYWGSNSQVLGICMEAIIGSKLLGTYNDTINKMALGSLNWILGANPMRKSFVSGYTDDSIKTAFASYSNDGKPGIPKGIMPGGPNRYQGAGLSIFPAKCYEDSADDWTTNEHNIGSNSTLVFITAFANSTSTTTVKPGDANDDGNVNIVDALVVARYVAGLTVSINAANSDVNCDSLITIIDALKIAQYVAGLVSVLNCN
jgi:hypothetical protein